jgi:hypothetical protein
MRPRLIVGPREDGKCPCLFICISITTHAVILADYLEIPGISAKGTQPCSEIHPTKPRECDAPFEPPTSSQHAFHMKSSVRHFSSSGGVHHNTSAAAPCRNAKFSNSILGHTLLDFVAVGPPLARVFNKSPDCL